ncbi:hypothetical protein H257_17819 [Aphanomyces astaci]|uniref:Uncharacterized protein n=1 Tax=Aphanomyces astaci TaxID=112090 RepID=W4FFD1_APHAT|nr:hypothetical protein H257_17819 [Aphanomyces astaci]ETV65453.1 hypothetical protein H257_17819 [Aphanomyces astaci]|eukprot:XP_009845064.1 hypothetical protein H257_17819 [Aphanomyces astaci]
MPTLPSVDPPVNTISTTSVSVSYTSEMVTTLLHLRFTVYRAPFNRHNSTKQLGVLWSKLALQFNIVFDSNPKWIRSRTRSVRCGPTTSRSRMLKRRRATRCSLKSRTTSMRCYSRFRT